MVYQPPYPWYIDSPTHGISTPLPMVYRPPTWYFYPYPWHFYALSMEYRPSTHGILTHLYPWYFDPLPMTF
jgi:hypothetical protein